MPAVLAGLVVACASRGWGAPLAATAHVAHAFAGALATFGHAPSEDERSALSPRTPRHHGSHGSSEGRVLLLEVLAVPHPNPKFPNPNPATGGARCTSP